MQQSRVAKRVLRTAQLIDWAGVLRVGPLRGGVVSALTLAATYTDPTVALPITIGSVLAVLVDPSGTFGIRVRAMGLTTLFIAGSTALAVLVADSLPLHLAMAALIAFALGYVGIAGVRAGVAGMVGLVAFAVFSGTPQPIGDAPEVAFFVLLGGAIQVAVITIPTLLRRLEEIRSEVFVAYRALGYSLKHDARGIPAITAATRINTARERIPLSGAEGASRAWLEELVEVCDHARVGFFALAAEREERDEHEAVAVEALMAAAATLTLRIAAAMHVPVLRRRIAPALVEFQGVAAETAGAMPTERVAIITSIRRDLERAAALAQGDWPIGRRAECGPLLRIPSDAFAGPRRLPTLDRPFVIHGARLALAFTLGTLIAETIFPLPHAYWLPMTVAWLTKPGLSDSAIRLVQRFFGTVIGVTVVSVAFAIGGGDVFAIVLVGVATAVIVAFAAPNYLIATEGVTVFALSLFWIAGAPLTETAPARVVATGAAAILVWLVMMLWRPVIADRVLLELAAQAQALREYARICRLGDVEQAERARLDFVRARVAAGGAITVAANEMAEHRVDEDCAETIHRDLIRASAVPVIVELTGDQQEQAMLTDDALASLDLLSERLTVMQETGVPPARTATSRGGVFADRIADAHSRLDALVV